MHNFGGAGIWCSSEGTCLLLMWPGFSSGYAPYVGLVIVVRPLLALRDFPKLILPPKKEHFQFNLTWMENMHEI